jgi:hypothetical protein
MLHEVQAALAVEQNREDIPGNARIVLIVKSHHGCSSISFAPFPAGLHRPTFLR